MSQVIDVKVGKKYAVYLPKRIAEALQIREGDRLILIVEGDNLVLRKPRDFFEASLQTPKKLKLSPEEVEESSLEAQREVLGI
ncbi:AbrB/MazE/SpoVT family DNA-binding domain-containing protein [Candidatus Bathyarchaeota archaeon]|nr:AbrB/MazE/SpoVT family DNA-binding domain-containing protein [Candidatus Bathyarchaeota archaeon]